MKTFNLIQGDCLELMKSIPDESVDMVLSSPPYNIGKEYEDKKSLKDYLSWHNSVVVECSRVLRNGGSIAWQVGNYISRKSVYPIDCLVFGQFIEAGLIPRNRIIWTFGHGLHCRNRFSGRHETILWFSKGDLNYFDLDSVRIPQKYPNKRHYKGAKKGEISGNPLGKNPGDVWEISNVKHNHPEKTSHPCQFPEQLSDRLVKSICPFGGYVLDPFMGSGTAGVSCINNGRNFIGIEMDAGYFQIAKDRIEKA